MPHENKLAIQKEDENSVAHPEKTDPLPTLMDQMVSGALGPLSRIRESVDMTLDQVSDWITQPRNRHQIANLVTLLDAQTQLIVCQHRLIAVSRLADVAESATSPETVRRACSDLLRIRLIDPYQEDKRPEKMPPPPVYSEEEILATLERMGTESPPEVAPESPPESPSESDKPAEHHPKHEVDEKEPLFEESEKHNKQNNKTRTFAHANYNPARTSAHANVRAVNENPESNDSKCPQNDELIDKELQANHTSQDPPS